ncbi:MAG: DUF262 domain-containing protein [Armatimonadetes bacterium]|nr:DUF262 domain-containing protein [Armatimonadota bacterium]
MQKVGDGRIQLPDFQREWVWDTDHITGLLASVSMSYPVGAIMMLETDDHQQFRPIALQGASFPGETKPDQLVLDGQQRLTSLFLSIQSGNPVRTKDSKGKSIDRWYYIDIRMALDANGDREDAIFGVPADRILKSFRNEPVRDLSTREREYEDHVFPVSEVFDHFDWLTGYQEYHGYDAATLKRFNEFYKEIIERFKQYQIPAIVLTKKTPKEAVCQVFEKVNTGGVTLTVFELLTATFAIDGFRLRDDWKQRSTVLKRHKVLSRLEATDFIQTVTLLAARERRAVAIRGGTPEDSAPGIGSKRKDMLKLTLAEYKQWADVAQGAYEEVVRFLHQQRVFNGLDVPYGTQLIPLSAIAAALGKRFQDAGVRAKVARWYWCGVFGELYGGTIESRFAKDLPEVLLWVDGGDEPTTVRDALFSEDRLYTMRTRLSAAYKGLYALFMREGSVDLRTGEPVSEVQTYFDEAVDVHHLFPQKWCSDHAIDWKYCDSIINKAPLTARTNRIIGGNAPSEYLLRLEKSVGIDSEHMNQHVSTHMVDPAALRADDFEAFFGARKEALISKIEEVMGKPVIRSSAQPEPEPEPEPTEPENESEVDFQESD